MEFTIFILALPLISFLVLALAGMKMSHKVAGLIGTASLAAVAVMSYVAAALYFGGGRGADGLFPTLTPYNFTWLPFTDNLHIDMGVMLDPISVMMLIVISTVSLMVHIYSFGYMKGEKGFQRYYAFLSLFTFSIAGLPAAIFCGLLYCLVRHITGTLWSCMMVHLIFNLYALFLQTNVAKYFLSSQNRLLLVVVVIAAWLICTTLFCNESARIFKNRADEIKRGESTSSFPDLSIKRLGKNLKSIFTCRPVMICAIVSAALFAAITAIGYFA